MTIPLNLIGIIALRFVGQAHDITGNYDFGFTVFLVTILLSVVMVALIKPPERVPVSQPVGVS